VSFLGIDIGTSQAKAVAFDDRLRTLAQAHATYERTYPRPGQCELDPRGLAKAVRSVVGQCAAQCGNDRVRSLAFSVFGGGVCAIDVQGEPLLPIISTTDNRAQQEAQDWADRFGRQRTYVITGTTTHASLMLPKILWIRKHLADPSWIWRFVTAAELATSTLDGPTGMDAATASTTMLLDIRAKQWSTEILEAADLSAQILPPVVPSGTVMGQIPGSVCQDLGLSPGCLLVAGGHDQQVCALGAGLTAAGQATDSLGTVECITTLFDAPRLVDDLLENNFSNLLHVYGARIATLAYNFSSGDLIRWYCSLFRPGVAAMDSLFVDLPDRPAQVFVLPHFAGSGTPHLDAQSKGAILGLSLATDRREILRAIVDGQNYEMRLNLDVWRRNGIAFDTLRVYGKGSASDRLMQIKADALGLAIERLTVVETGCLGAALLAARAAEPAFPLEDALRSAVGCQRRFEPQREMASAYDERYALYRELYPSVRPLHHRM
jgi:xylulokinase